MHNKETVSLLWHWVAKPKLTFFSPVRFHCPPYPLSILSSFLPHYSRSCESSREFWNELFRHFSFSDHPAICNEKRLIILVYKLSITIQGKPALFLPLNVLVRFSVQCLICYGSRGLRLRLGPGPTLEWSLIFINLNNQINKPWPWTPRPACTRPQNPRPAKMQYMNHRKLCSCNAKV